MSYLPNGQRRPHTAKEESTLSSGRLTLIVPRYFFSEESFFAVDRTVLMSDTAQRHTAY